MCYTPKKAYKNLSDSRYIAELKKLGIDNEFISFYSSYIDLIAF